MKHNILVLDFETYYDRDYSLSKISTEAYIRDPRFEIIGGSIKRGPEPAQFYDPMELHVALLNIDWANTALLAHNTYFDGAILGWHYGHYPAFYLDTMSMARPRHNLTIGCTLAALATHYGVGEKGTEVVLAMGKRRSNFTGEEYAAYGRYCCNDVELTWRLFCALRQESKHEYHLIDQYQRTIIQPLLQLDTETLTKHLEEVRAYKEASLTMAGLELGIEPEELLLQVRSNEKFAALLKSIGVDPPTKISPTTGQVTWAFNKTDGAFLDFLEAAQNDPDTTLSTLIDARVQNKSSIEETRTLALLGVASRGTLAVPLGHYLAHTGRAGGFDRINLQNLPVREQRYEYPIRRAIMAPPNHVCLSADLAQIEARVLAWLAGQQDIVDAFTAYDAGQGPDIYCVTASNIFGRPITRADEKERFIGKVVRLALGYGMAYVKFQRVARMGGQTLTLAEADRIVRKHRALSDRIVTLWNQGDSALHCIANRERGVLGRHGVVQVSGEGIHLPMWDRVIRYPSLTYHERTVQTLPHFTYRSRKKFPRVYGAKVIENVVQALAGIIVAEAWLRLAARGLTVVLQVHDELVLVLHRDDVEQWLPVIREEMTRVPAWAPGLPVACSIGFHERYGLAKA